MSVRSAKAAMNIVKGALTGAGPYPLPTLNYSYHGSDNYHRECESTILTGTPLGIPQSSFPADERELLNALASFYFAFVEITGRIGHEHVYGVELSRIAAVVPEHAHHGAVAPA